MNELVVINNSMALSFQNEKLNESVRRIQAYARNAKVAYLQIAFELKVIKDNELYKEDGYTSIVEFAERVLNCSKSTTNRMIQVADSFLVNEGTIIKSVFAQGEEDFSFNQLRETLSLRRQEVEKLVSSGRLLPSMTVKEIRIVVQEEKNKEEKSDDILVKEEEGSCASATEESSSSSVQSEYELKEENKGINSEIIADSISSSSSIQSDNLSSETSSQTAQNAPESTLDGSLVSNYQNSSQSLSTGLQSSSISSSQEEHELKYEESKEEEYPSASSISSSYSGEHELKDNDIDFMIAQLAGDEEEEEFPVAPYEFTFFNCRKEVSESKKVRK